MPRDFEGLTREPYGAVEKFSKIPSSSLRPVSLSKIGPSRLPSSTYNPSASRRLPKSESKSYVSQAGAKNTSQESSQYASSSQTPSPSQHARESHRPSSSQVTRESHRSSQSQTLRESHRPFPSQALREPQRLTNYPSSTTSSVRPPTAIYSPISKVKASKPHPSASRIYERTKAPPADEEGPDLEVLLNSDTIISPRQILDEPLSPPGATTYHRKLVATGRSSSASTKPQAPSHSKW